MFYDKPWFLGGLCKGKGVIRILNLTFGVVFFDLTIIWGYDFINYNWLVNKFCITTTHRNIYEANKIAWERVLHGTYPFLWIKENWFSQQEWCVSTVVFLSHKRSVNTSMDLYWRSWVSRRKQTVIFMQREKYEKKSEWLAASWIFPLWERKPTGRGPPNFKLVHS